MCSATESPGTLYFFRRGNRRGQFFFTATESPGTLWGGETAGHTIFFAGETLGTVVYLGAEGLSALWGLTALWGQPPLCGHPLQPQEQPPLPFTVLEESYKTAATRPMEARRRAKA